MANWGMRLGTGRYPGHTTLARHRNVWRVLEQMLHWTSGNRTWRGVVVREQWVGTMLRTTGIMQSITGQSRFNAAPMKWFRSPGVCSAWSSVVRRAQCDGIDTLGMHVIDDHSARLLVEYNIWVGFSTTKTCTK